MNYTIVLQKFLKHWGFVALAAIITAAITSFSSPEFAASLKGLVESFTGMLPLGIGKLLAPALYSALLGVIAGGLGALNNFVKHFND